MNILIVGNGFEIKVISLNLKKIQKIQKINDIKFVKPTKCEQK